MTTGSWINGSDVTSSMRKPGAMVNVLSASSGDSAGAGGATMPSADCSVGPVVGRDEGLVEGLAAARVVERDAGEGSGFVVGADTGVAARTAACGFAPRRAPDVHAPNTSAPAEAI